MVPNDESYSIAEPGDDAMTILLLMKRVNGKQSALASKLEDRAG